MSVYTRAGIVALLVRVYVCMWEYGFQVETPGRVSGVKTNDSLVNAGSCYRSFSEVYLMSVSYLGAGLAL